MFFSLKPVLYHKIELPTLSHAMMTWRVQFYCSVPVWNLLFFDRVFFSRQMFIYIYFITKHKKERKTTLNHRINMMLYYITSLLIITIKCTQKHRSVKGTRMVDGKEPQKQNRYIFENFLFVPCDFFFLFQLSSKEKNQQIYKWNDI